MPSEELMNEPRPRRFQLVRHDDVSGASGTGVVAEGVEHRDDTVHYRWLTAPRTSQIAGSIHDVRHIHGHGGKTTVRWLDDQGPPGEDKSITEVYEDRNLLALGFARLVQQYPATGYAAGWHPDQGEDADADEWAVVWAEIPSGQVSWHVPGDLAAGSELTRAAHEWDGHTVAEKNRRLAAFARDD